MQNTARNLLMAATPTVDENATCDIARRPTSATIRIVNLRLRTYIGFNPEEQAKRQDVVINLLIQHAVNKGIFEDVIEDALNYKVITKDIIQLIEQGRFLLLEKLVADVVGICSQHAEVSHASVTIEKSHALRFADSVSLTMEYENLNNKRK
jgi:D-erythro-7,8-dihydroneopterin triphosphate epimerase